MKLFRMFSRSFRDAFKSVFRNFSLSLSSITSSTITLVIVAIAIIVTLNVQNFTKNLEETLTIVVFVEEGTNEKELDILEEQINEISNVADVEFESKLEVKKNIQEDSDVMSAVLDTWSDEELPLLDTFKVTLKEVEFIEKNANTIKELEKVKIVNYGKEYAVTMIDAFATIEKITYIVVIALIVVTVFLIVNTIKLTIFSRKREISIMRLVGASNTTIKLPFIIEGMILGILGAIIPVVFTTYGYLTFYNAFGGVLITEMLKLIEPEPFIYQVSLIVVGIGMVVGMLGSANAVRKYLKV